MKFTTPIKMNHEFRRAYSKGKSAATPRLVLYARQNKRGGNKLGITVSTKLGKAVVRNRIKRRFREIYRLNETKLSAGYDIIMVARMKSVDADFSRLENDFLYLAGKLGVLCGD